MRRGVAYALVGLVAAATLVACGDDDDAAGTVTTTTGTTTTGGGTSVEATTAGSGVSAADATEADYLAAVVRSFTTGAEDELQLDDEQAACVAPKWLDTIGVDRLKEQGVAPDQIGDDTNTDGSALSDLGLSEHEGNELYDAFDACDVDIHQEFVRSITAGGGLSDEASTCVSDAIDADLLRRLMVASITQGDAALDEDSPLAADFNTALAPCQELADAGG